MMKFFRKRQKEMLAIFMAGLLIIWLGGTAVESLMYSGQQTFPMAQTRYGKVTNQDTSAAQAYTSLIEGAFGEWQYPAGRLSREPLTLVDWVVATREAHRLGTRPPSAAARAELTDIGGDGLIATLAQHREVKTEHVVDAFAELTGVRQAAIIASRAAVPSEAAFRAAAHDALETVRINAVLLPSKAFQEPDQPVTDEEVAELFEKHRTSQAGMGLDFGYMIPPSVRVQYVKVDVNKISDSLRVAEETLDAEARELWEKDKERREFKRPEPEKKLDEPTTADDASSETDADEGDDGEEEKAGDEADGDEPEVEGPEYFETWEEAREAARAIVRKERAERAADRIITSVSDQMRNHWYGAAPRDDGYKDAPAVMTAAGYALELVSQVPERFRYPDAVSVVTTGFFAQREARDVAEIGSAFGEGFRQIRDLAFLVQGLVDIPEDNQVDRSRFLSLYQPSSYILEDASGARYLWRVVETRGEKEPESAAEVLKYIHDDVRTLRGYRAAQAAAATLLEAARQDGLKPAFDASEALKDHVVDGVAFRRPEPFARQMRFNVTTGRYARTNITIQQVATVAPEVVDSIFALADQQPPLTSFELENQAMVLVVEWVETLPAREDEFAELRQQSSMTLDFLTRQTLAEWVSPQNLRARNGVETP